MFVFKNVHSKSSAAHNPIQSYIDKQAACMYVNARTRAIEGLVNPVGHFNPFEVG